MKCRHCGANLDLVLVDLGSAPPSNAYLTEQTLHAPEMCYPLRVLVCEQCWLVQIEDYKKADEIFDSSYAYFASYSSSWLEHSRQYVEMAVERFGLGPESLVYEIASNDGYLLQYVRERGVPCLGIEPTASTASASREKGIETIERFYGVECARRLVSERGQADLIIANNVLAHVPDINDFVKGIRIALKQGGTVTFEFPHLLKLLRYNQFDTIYHEHFSYLSLTVVRAILATHGLTVYDVQALATHGGSLRVFARHEGNTALTVLPAVNDLDRMELDAGLRSSAGYLGFQEKTDRIRTGTLRFLHECRGSGKRVAAYGAAAKGNTLLNYCGIKGNDLIAYVVDRSPHKKGLFLPGSHIPIVDEERFRDSHPNIILLLPWNLRVEIALQLAYVREWGARFAVCVPNIEVF